MTLSRGQGLAVSVDFKLLEEVIGIHSRKVGVHVGKDAHWERWLCGGQLGGTEDKHGRGPWKADQLGSACQQADGEMCNISIKVKLPLESPS